MYMHVWLYSIYLVTFPCLGSCSLGVVSSACLLIYRKSPNPLPCTSRTGGTWNAVPLPVWGRSDAHLNTWNSRNAAVRSSVTSVCVSAVTPLYLELVISLFSVSVSLSTHSFFGMALGWRGFNYPEVCVYECACVRAWCYHLPEGFHAARSFHRKS